MSGHKEKVLNLIAIGSGDGDDPMVSKLKLIENELKVVYFIAALDSYRSDSLLRPFPSDFVLADNRKDFDRLREVAKLLPSLSTVRADTELPDDCWRLIHWILTANSIKLQLLNAAETKQLYARLKLNAQSNSLPHFVFKLISPSARRARHNSLKDENGSFDAFHGTSFENLHSILHNGLVNNLNKRAAFGSGTYLSKTLDVCLNFSPYTYVQSNCFLKRLSCILLCDVVQHPSINILDNSSYCLVQDDDFVDVTHVFLYGQIERDQSKSLPRYELFVLVIGLMVALYTIYRSNGRY